ncbi:hypothetical protein [Gracilimonas tropica]|uniref:hypothetical protein n=1 Tax=Gracilimonas tropica TaxID=454600 RepID=UPI00035C528C|nr:hypothetical protein [Gracilimonas tropica]
MIIPREQKILLVVAIQFFAGIFTAGAQTSSSRDELLADASQYFASSQEQKALDAYLQVLGSDKDNFEALWHVSLLYARIGYRLGSDKEMSGHYKKSLKYAERTLELYPDSGRSHFVYAVANGRLSDISGTNERLKKSHVVKEHAEKAVKLLPDYAPAWHLLGLWHSKVANVGSVEKFTAGLFSEGLPEGASNEKAEACIQKAIELDPSQSLRFKLDLARHYQRAGEEQKARYLLKEVVKMNAENSIDRWNLKRARELLEELS